jgi:cysteine desulfurase
MRRIYLDHAATTPVDPRVLRAMRPYFTLEYGNPGSLHSFGQEAIAALDGARETVAKAIGRPPAGGFREVIFTGSATEANNLALRGAVKHAMQMMRMHANAANNSHYSNGFVDSHRARLIVSAIEHESVIETAHDLAASFGEASLASGREHDGVEVVVVPVDKRGVVDVQKLKVALNERTVLVSVMYANNEIGTVQPIAEIAKIIGDFREQRAHSKEHIANGKNDTPFAISHLPLLHTDAVQAFQYFDCDVQKLGVDLLTLSAHKIGGPKGVGALYARQHMAYSKGRIAKGGESGYRAISHTPYAISQIVTGGGQEFGMRSGTENVPSIVGFAKAVELAAAARERETRRVGDLTRHFWQGIRRLCSKAAVNGVPLDRRWKSRERLPNMLNVWFPGFEAQDLLTALDRAGVAASAGSACSARSFEPSYVVRALGLSESRVRSSVRFSLGRTTTRRDIDTSLRVIGKLLKRRMK